MDAIEYFESNAKLPGVIDGGICIFAAGNDAYHVPSDPGAYYSNICVTAFGPNFTAGSYTNYEPAAADTDEWALKNHYIAVVPIKVDLTDYARIDMLKGLKIE